MPDTDRFTVRFKAFDYGVISVALTKAFSGTWEEWVDYGLACHENSALAQIAERIGAAITRPRDEFLAEDYLVFAATHTDDGQTADELLAAHGGTMAQLLRGERSALSAEEREEVLRHHISYFADDLVIPTWRSP